MKTFGIIAIVALFLVLIYIRLKMIYNRINFEFAFRGADISSLNIQSLLSTGQTQSNILMSAKIINGNDFSITVSGIRAWMYYNNTLVAQSNPELANNEVVVPENGSAAITDNVIIYFNKDSAILIKDVVTKQRPKVKYTIKLKIWGINVTWNDYFIWEF